MTVVSPAEITQSGRGNAFVSVDDIRAVAMPALRHRLLMNFEGEAEQVDVDTIVNELLATVATE